MSTEKRDRNDVYTAMDGERNVAQPDGGGQIQLSFFDAVTPAEMNTYKNNGPMSEQESVPHTEPLFADATQPPAIEAQSPEATSPIEAIAQHELAPPHEASAHSAPDDEHFETELVHDDVGQDESLGQRMRAAREARGLSREEVASRTRVQTTIIAALESDQFDKIGHGVYLRGYLHKYLAFLDLPVLLADRVLQTHSDLPPLTTSGTISRPRYLFQRYSGSALYLVLTGVIIVPAVLLAMRAGFDSNLVRITPLDSADTTSVARNADTDHKANDPTAPATDIKNIAPAQTPAAEDRPLAASMTPFPPTTVAEVSKPATIEAAVPEGQHSLTITLAESSWVEIVTTDGQKLEYGLLAAGVTRSYHSAQTIDVRLGNVTGATVQVDGKPQDLTNFRHSNVAHFKLAGGDTTLSHSGG